MLPWEEVGVILLPAILNLTPIVDYIHSACEDWKEGNLNAG